MSAFDYTFGVEIECFTPEANQQMALGNALMARCGIQARVGRYTDRNRGNEWLVKPDGSLGDYERGVEIVSPILSGQQGLNLLGAVMDTATDFGCTVNKKCGVHVHVGCAAVADLSFFKSLFKLYAQHETVIDAFMPESRRKSANTYIRSLTGVDLAKVERAQSLEKILGLMMGNDMGRFHDSVRYHKLNLFVFHQRGKTVEFRQHSGTVDKAKVAPWVMLCLKMVDAAVAGRSLGVRPGGAAQMNTAKPGSKTWMVGQMALRPEGVTVAQALEATGWNLLSMPPTLRDCGLQFTKVRHGRIVTYYAQAALASTPSTPSLSTLTSLLNLSGEEAAYFQARTANLSGPVAWAA